MSVTSRHTILRIINPFLRKFLKDAPSDGNEYVRKDGDWAIVTASSGVTEAPLDSNDYVRNNGAWQIADYFSGAWGDLTGVPGTFTPSAHTHAASDVVSGTFANARISQASVTQHEAALTITESQITDLGTYIEDAPSDGTTYGRNNGAWVAAGGGGFLEAPATGLDYARNGLNEDWHRTNRIFVSVSAPTPNAIGDFWMENAGYAPDPPVGSLFELASCAASVNPIGQKFFLLPETS